MPRVNAMPYRSRPVPGSTVERRKALRARAAGRASDSRSGGRSPASGPTAAPPSGPSSADRYGGDVLAADPHRVGPHATRPESVHVAVEHEIGRAHV